MPFGIQFLGDVIKSNQTTHITQVHRHFFSICGATVLSHIQVTMNDQIDLKAIHRHLVDAAKGAGLLIDRNRNFNHDEVGFKQNCERAPVPFPSQ